MKDEERFCECGQSHPWGIVRYSQDNTPLYGPRPLPTCDDFRPKVDEAEKALAASVPNLGEIWAQTGDLDAQATLATRIVVARLRSLGETAKKNGALARIFGSSTQGIQAIANQWPEFVGFVISQITDMRGTLIRDETKFAHLVAHTDEIVEAMRGVTQLSERLRVQEMLLSEIYARLEKLTKGSVMYEEDYAEDEALRHFGLWEEGSPYDPSRFTPSQPNEALLVEKIRDEDGDQQQDEGDDDSEPDDEDPEEE